MGGKSGKSVESPQNPNGKKIDLLIEICGSWGFSGKKYDCMTLIKKLANEGYEVSYHIEPLNTMEGGEFDIFKIEGGKKRIVFSNSKKQQGIAVVAYSLSDKLMPDVIKKITEITE